MSVKRYDAKRDQNEKRIVAVLKGVGATVQPLSMKGVPDLLVGFRGNVYLLETKTKKGKLTEPQQEWSAWWAGRAPIVVRTEDDALKAIGAIDR